MLPVTRSGARRAALRLACLALGAVLLSLLLPGPARVARQTAARKLGRGLAGMTLGVLEVPGRIVRTTRSDGPALGFTLGFAQGLGRLIVREVVGVYEFLTAPFELPAGFEPILEPEFPWNYFEER